MALLWTLLIRPCPCARAPLHPTSVRGQLSPLGSVHKVPVITSQHNPKVQLCRVGVRGPRVPCLSSRGWCCPPQGRCRGLRAADKEGREVGLRLLLLHNQQLHKLEGGSPQPDRDRLALPCRGGSGGLPPCHSSPEPTGTWTRPPAALLWSWGWQMDCSLAVASLGPAAFVHLGASSSPLCLLISSRSGHQHFVSETLAGFSCLSWDLPRKETQ